MKISKSTKGYFLALLAGTTWGAMGIFVRVLQMYGFDSMTISAYRPCFAIIIYVLINLIKDPKCFKTDIKGLILFAFYGIVALDGMFISSSYAVQYIGVSTASVLLFINPIIVMILSYFIFNEELTVKKILALFLSIIGCILVVRAYKVEVFKVNLEGILWGLFSGVAVALQNILGKIYMKKYEYKTMLIYSFLFGAIFLCFFTSPVRLVKEIVNIKSLASIIGVSIVATLIPSISITKSLNYIEAGKSSIIAGVEPLVACILAFIIFGEVFEFPQFIGMILIIVAILILQLKSKNSTSLKENIIDENYVLSIETCNNQKKNA